jgi:hypothetical protein
MKRKLIVLSRQYVAALRKHLKQGPRAIPPCGTALALGRQAAALNLETLDVARIASSCGCCTPRNPHS